MRKLILFLGICAGAFGQSVGVGPGVFSLTPGSGGGGSGTVTSVSFTGGLISVATATTTPAFTVAGTSGGIPYFNSGTTWETSTALAANSLVIGGGAGTAPSTITTGSNILAALGVNVGSAGAPVLFNGAGGTPSSLTLTSASGLPVAGLSNLGANVGTFLITPSSANLASAVTGETGSGALVFATSPALVTPDIGVATGTSVTVTGALTSGSGGGVSGDWTSTEGTAPSLTANAFSIYSPTDVAAGGLAYVLPAAASTGVMLATNSAGVMTLSHVAAGSSGNVLTSDGATWSSAAPSGGVSLSANNTWTGIQTFTPTARSSGVAAYFPINIPTDTGVTAATEAPGVKLTTATRTWATTGTVAIQREVFLDGPTYASASASQTFSDVMTLGLTPPVQGANAIFTRNHSLGLLDSTSAASAITGGLVVATTFGTAATSVGIGGGNVYAGSSITAGGSVFGTTKFELLDTGGGSGGSLHIGGRGYLSATASGAWLLQNEALSGWSRLMFALSTTSGAAIGFDAVNGFTIQSGAGSATWNDASTAGSGTVANRYIFGIAAPTLTATNASVTDTVASTLYIGGAPTASTNTTIGAGYALNVAAGTSTFGGKVQSTSATAGVGYGTGAGGTITQATNRSTGVTLNTVTGTITTDTTSLAALASASFTVTNSAVAVGDIIVLSIRSGQTNKKTRVNVTTVAAGSFELTVVNDDATTAETGAIIINFAIIKGVTS